MKTIDKIAILGASGFGKEVLANLLDCYKLDIKTARTLFCFLEQDEFLKETNSIHGFKVKHESEFNPADEQVIVAIGNPQQRKTVVEKLPKTSQFATIIHPSVVKSPWVTIDEGSIVCAGSVLTDDVKIGKHAHINLNTTVGHNSTFGQFVTTAPAVNISGDCSIGDLVYFGTNACVLQGLNIASRTTIGMGAVVIRSIEETGTYVGNPAKRITK